MWPAAGGDAAAAAAATAWLDAARAGDAGAVAPAAELPPDVKMTPFYLALLGASIVLTIFRDPDVVLTRIWCVLEAFLGLVEAPPGEEGTRIHLPRRRDVRVPQHPLRGDIGMARQNLLGQGNDLDKLRLGKRQVVAAIRLGPRKRHGKPVIAGRLVHDFDADGGVVQGRLPGPEAPPRVPGPAIFGHKAKGPAAGAGKGGVV